MKTWKLGTDGFIKNYMVAGPLALPFSSDVHESDQLENERVLRGKIVREKPEDLKTFFERENGNTNPGSFDQEGRIRIKAGQIAPNGKTWEIYASSVNCFLDRSAFYSTLQRIEMEAATCLYVEEDMKVSARFYTFMAAGIYLNGKKAGEVTRPVYKPIEYRDLTLDLKKGENLLYIVCENLGARDTRNLFALEIREETNIRDKIRIALPDSALQDEVYDAAELLDSMRLTDGKIVWDKEADDTVSLSYLHPTRDFYQKGKEEQKISLYGRSSLEVPEAERLLKVSIEKPSFTMERTFEFQERLQRQVYDEAYVHDPDNREHAFRDSMQRIASVKSLDRGEFGFAIMNILARRAITKDVPGAYEERYAKEDRKLLLKDLDLIEERCDCADFLLCGFIRYLRFYPVDEALKARIKEVFLGFRYWMDEKGSDAMCFWSENHTLMFYSAAMFIGEMYPEETFTLAEKKGADLSKWGREHVLEWLDDVEAYGFEEFQSVVYVNVTFAALLNLVDFADPDISRRARAITDDLIRALCRQVFHGVVMSPMGRVYRDVIYPFQCGTQAIVNLIDPKAPYTAGEGWIAYLPTSTYRFPEDCQRIMEETGWFEYESGNAKICVKKTEDYILSSVQSPREDDYHRWENVRLRYLSEKDGRTGVRADQHVYTKALNESFHGTSLFEPGTYGYQQHMWMAALDEDAILFINHPGSTSEVSDMRPGYWHGNGSMPALKQCDRFLLAIYRIPEELPVKFTHIYCPAKRFDTVEKEKAQDGEWLFLKKGNSFMGLFSTGELTPWNQQLFGCEYRIYDTDAAFFIGLGSTKEDGSFEQFKAMMHTCQPVYTKKEALLSVTLPSLNGKNVQSLSYVRSDDQTQYIL